MSRKEASFGQLLRYINKPVEKGCGGIVHNLRTDVNDCEQVEKEFVENHAFARVRKNGVVLFHEVISLSGKDGKRVSEEVLEDLGRRYLELRAGKALAYGRVHFDGDNPHLHLMISGNEVGSGKQVRVSRGEFSEIKKELEAYQREQYPELVNSIAQERKSRTRKMFLKDEGRQERERSRRVKLEGVKSEKERVFDVVGKVLRECGGGAVDISKHLECAGLLLYQRGKSVGVQDIESGKKYRLKTLGLDKAYEEAVERGRVFEKVVVAKSRRRVRALGFAAGLLEVAGRVVEKKLEVKEKKREEAWREIGKGKRRRWWERGRGR